MNRAFIAKETAAFKRVTAILRTTLHSKIGQFRRDQFFKKLHIIKTQPR